MTPREFLGHVRAKGASIRLRDGALVYAGPTGALRDEARQYISENRCELIRYLTRKEIAHICVEQVRDGGPCIMRIEGLAIPVVALLDGAPDDFERDELLDGLEVWRMSELRELRTIPVSEREYVAYVRWLFEGVLLPSSDENEPDGSEG